MEDNEFASLVLFAIECIGDRERALQWLITPNWGLGTKPIDLLTTENGGAAVRRALSAIAYGGPA